MAALLTPQSSPNPKAHGTLMKVKHGYSWDVNHLTSKLLFTTSCNIGRIRGSFPAVLKDIYTLVLWIALNTSVL